MANSANPLASILKKATSNIAFRQALIDNPKAILKAEGIDIPPHVSVQVVEDTTKQVHIALPAPALSDEELEDVTGGAKGITVNACHW